MGSDTIPMKNDAQLSIGLVGAGAISRKSHMPVLTNTPNVRIAWIYDRRPETATALAAAYGVTAIHSIAAERLPPCDVALLAIPVDARHQYLKAFSERGTAVLCEKPFAMTAAEHSSALDIFAPYALAAGFMRRFFASTQLLRRITRDAIFGSLLRIDVSEGNRSKGSGAELSFLEDTTFGASRGVLTDLGSHSLDLALYVSAATDFCVQACSRVMDAAVDRKVSATVVLRNSAVESAPPIELNYGVSWLDRQENRIRLTFEKATVWSGVAPASEVYVGDPDYPRDAILLASQAKGATTYNQAFFLEWQHFLDAFRAKRESLVSARSALLTTSLVEALLTAGESTYA
jgi:predicted dehydrogenase